ncbi:MAG: chain length-determining protein [Candidatus Accumulibacter sp.]|jgi:polysaccharide chain length determinant protein (PEP-CTERM system associated)|nr:chain length-determining protein [Accumulibacter sp.]
MDEILRQATIILRGMWKHRWLGFAAAWAIAVISVIVVFRIPDRYEASARIYVDTQSILKPLMSGLAIEPNMDQQIKILSRTLISRPNVEKLIRMADLDLNVKNRAGMETLVDELTKTLRIQSTSRDNLYTLAYADPQPERARRVVQSLVSIFVESSLGNKRKDSDSAKKFIDDQIQVYQKKLEEAENRLKDFKLKNISAQTGEGKDYFGRLSEVSTELERARLELREAENSRDALKRQIAGEEPTLLSNASGAVAEGIVPEIDGRIDALKRNLDGLLQRYTDRHPDVVGTRRMIQELEEQRLQEIAARKKGAASNPAMAASANPVYQQLKVSLAESEASVASLQTRVVEYQSRYNQLKDAMKMIPQIEAELVQLNRDYDIHKKNYESLVARRESATISGEMDASTASVDFRLIDPPRVGSKPVYPNRLLLLPMTLLLALAAGFFSPFVASQLRPVFFDARALREATGLPLLGVVSRKVPEAEVAREKRLLRLFILGVMALFAAYGSGMALLVYLSTRSA